MVAAVLGASLLHASWHVLVKSSGDRVVALAGMNAVSGVVALSFIPFVRVPGAAVFAVIAVSVLLHVGYKIALARLYGAADLGQAYPIARGLTPIAATALALLLLGEVPDRYRLGGILLISAGILALVYEGGRRPLRMDLMVTGALTGTAVAAYSVVDAVGVRMHGDWLSFTAWLVACDSLAFIGYSLCRRPGTLTGWKSAWKRVLISGLLGTAAFGVFMWALGRAPVGPVTALRETSVVFAALLGATILREPTTRIRFLAVGAVAAGAMVIALARQPS